MRFSITGGARRTSLRAGVTGWGRFSTLHRATPATTVAAAGVVRSTKGLHRRISFSCLACCSPAEAFDAAPRTTDSFSIPPAIGGFKPEASVTIRYESRTRVLSDGTRVDLRNPRYEVMLPLEVLLPASIVLMPRTAPPMQGAGLLERVPLAEILAVNADTRPKGRGVLGARALIGVGEDRVLGRFGWQATESSVASQMASTFASEMDQSTTLIPGADCGKEAHRGRTSPSGGVPEVEPSLFDAVVRFQQLHAVPVADGAAVGHAGCRFERPATSPSQRRPGPKHRGSRTLARRRSDARSRGVRAVAG